MSKSYTNSCLPKDYKYTGMMIGEAGMSAAYSYTSANSAIVGEKMGTSYEWINKADNSVVSTDRILYASTLGTGTHDLLYRVTDANGNTYEDAISVTVGERTNETNPLDIWDSAALANRSITQGTTSLVVEPTITFENLFELTAQTEAGQAIDARIVLDRGTRTVHLDTSTLTVGTHKIILTVVEGDAQSSFVYTVTVEANTNPTPQA